VTPDVKEYFQQQYNDSGIRVVPGHWPDFKSREQVDQWITLIKSMFEEAKKDGKEESL